MSADAIGHVLTGVDYSSARGSAPDAGAACPGLSGYPAAGPTGRRRPYRMVMVIRRSSGSSTSYQAGGNRLAYKGLLTSACSTTGQVPNRSEGLFGLFSSQRKRARQGGMTGTSMPMLGSPREAERSRPESTSADRAGPGKDLVGGSNG